MMKLILALKFNSIPVDIDEPEDKKVTLPSLFPPGKINGIKDLSPAARQSSDGTNLMLLPERI